MAPVVKNPPANAGVVRDLGLIPGSGRSPGEGNGNSLQYSCLENPMDRGARGTTVQGIAKSQIWLKQLSMHAHTHTQNGVFFIHEKGHLWQHGWTSRKSFFSADFLSTFLLPLIVLYLLMSGSPSQQWSPGEQGLCLLYSGLYPQCPVQCRRSMKISVKGREIAPHALGVVSSWEVS